MKTQNSNKQTNHFQSLVSEGSFFEGNLVFTGSIRIGGKITGSIKGSGTLIIEPSAQVEATVKVDELILMGDLTGEVFAKKSVIMEPPARFSGTVSSPSLSIKEGVFFEGSSKKYQL